MKNSGKKYRKLRVGSIEFSSELSKIGIILHFWHKVVHHKEGRFKNTNYLQLTAKKIQISSYNITLSAAIDYFKAEKHIYLLFKK